MEGSVKRRKFVEVKGKFYFSKAVKASLFQVKRKLSEVNWVRRLAIPKNMMNFLMKLDSPKNPQSLVLVVGVVQERTAFALEGDMANSPVLME